MRYCIVVFLLTLVCFQGVCAGDDISGSANLTYLSTETKTGEEETSSWGFTQTYNLQVTKEFTPKVNFAANLGINVNETNNTKTTRLTPDIRLNLRNEYFNADTGYRITEKGLDILTMVSDEDRFTTESWNVNLSTKSKKYPKVRLRYNEDRNYDHLATRETDTKTTNFSGSMDYKYRFLNFNYDYRNNISDNYVTESTTETDTHQGRVNFRKSFWKNKITTSGSYSITNKKTETKTKEQDVEVAEKKTADQGLHKEDTGDVTLVKLDSEPLLIDGIKDVSAGINIGGSPANDDQNIGLHLTFSSEIDKIYLYTRDRDNNFNKNNFTWAVYSSTDNDTWAPITAGASFDYNINQERFEISFTATTARYFKVVNTANDSYDLYVTEIEAYSSTTQAAFTTTETDQTTQTTQANLRYKPLDWLSFTYDFTQNEQDKEETDADSTKTRQSSHNISGRIGKEFKAHKYLKIRPEYRRRQEYKYDSETETKDKTTDTYRVHFLSSPLKTLDTDLSLNHTVSKEDGETRSKISSALLQLSAKLREGADLDVDANITRSENPVSQSETTTKYINSNLRLELTRMLTAEIEYNNNWTETETLDSSSTGRTHDAKCTLYWRPSHDFYLRGMYGINRDDKSGDETTQQQYNMNWLMTEKMQINMGYTLNRNDTISSTYSSDLSWNLSRTFTLRFGYNWSRQKAAIITETQTFTTNLSARF